MLNSIVDQDRMAQTMTEFDFGNLTLEEAMEKFSEYPIEEGTRFTVFILGDYVLKIPNQDYITDRGLEQLAQRQTALSCQVSNVLPCYKVNNYLIMPKARGTNVADLSEPTKTSVRKRIPKILKHIQALGYPYVVDANPENYFYYEDEVYVIDVHEVMDRQYCDVTG